MGISFSQPWYLLLLLIAVYSLILWLRSFKAFHPKQQKIFLGLRLGLILCLVLALAGVGLNLKHKQKSIVYLADLSASIVDQKQSAEDWIKKSLEALPLDDTAGIVSFGKKPMVEYPIGPASEFKELQAVINPNYTNLAAGLRLARSLLPDDRGKQIILLTDGKQNREDVMEQAKTLHRQGVRLDVLMLTSDPGPEALVKELRLPNRMLQGESFNLEAVLESTSATGGKLRLTVDNRILREEEVQLVKGENRLVWGAIAEGPGMHTYKLELNANKDTIMENNQGAAVTQVAGPPRVLVVEGQDGDGTAVKEALDAVNIEAELIQPPAVPKSLSALAKYSAVIMANVPAHTLPEQTLSSLETYVKDLGRGLVMVGGEDSFGPGGYYKTPVEKALPVYMDIKKKGEKPSVGLGLVIDKSGSMCHTINGVSKMDMAKEAAIRAMEVLEEKDQLGVVIFDSEYKWVVKTGPLSDKKDVEDKIGSIQPGGGTNMYPALESAYESLKDAKVKVKHIILLSDGVSKYGGDYEGLLKKLNEANITLTTVAVGSDSDIGLLTNLAHEGRGRYYFTNDISSIPAIFAKETFLATRSYLVQERFTPAITGSMSMLPSNHALPPLNGYVATTAKDSAEVILSSHQDDPVLARWQYGLGRSVAWTSDAKGRWAGDWVSWSSYPQFWGKVISWVLPQASDTGMVVSTSRENGEGKLTVEFPTERREVHDVLAKIAAPDGTTQEISVPATGPGRNQAVFPMDQQGAYLIQIVQTNGEQIARQATASMVQSYSPEYQLQPDQKQFLEELAEAGGGKLLSEGDASSAAGLQLEAVWGNIPLAPYLLFVAGLLLLLDIAARRFDLHLRWVRPLYEKSKVLIIGRRVLIEQGTGGLAEVMQFKKNSRENFYRASVSGDIENNPKVEDRSGLGESLSVLKRQSLPTRAEAEPSGKESSSNPRDKGSINYSEMGSKDNIKMVSRDKKIEKTSPKDSKSEQSFTSKLLEKKRQANKNVDDE